MAIKNHYLAIHTVFLPRENLFFIKEWLIYHKLLGVEHFYLYDNTGSIGRNGSTQKINKYGYDFHAMTNSLSDTDVQSVLEAILAEFEDCCTLVEWKPLDDQGRIIYAMADAYQHCVQTCISNTEWLCAIDMDEFLFSPDRSAISEMLKEIQAGGGTRAYVSQKKIRHCFMHLDKQVIDIEECIEGYDFERWGPKFFILTEAFDSEQDFNIHDIPVKTGVTYYINKDVLRFNHYNTNDNQLEWMTSFIECDEPYILNSTDAGMRRYHQIVHSECSAFGSPAWRRRILELEG